ncbi:MAG: dethiobiotin synthase [Candidatus Marinimicrobia bacterium]|nr:dethiobiotin synthase [Candidatus Neomarinimicrobiota bacterium]
MKNKNFFITAIGTNVGKTLISAMLVENLKAEYWKPIQAGNLDKSDSTFIREHTNCIKIHPERFILTAPMSPHAAAKIDNVKINLIDFKIPNINSSLIVEGAGGLMVPLNNNDLVLDLIKHLNLEVIIISQNYLGSINHTLLTIEVLKKNDIQINGIIFNGNSNIETERIIEHKTRIQVIGKIPKLDKISKKNIIKYSKKIQII